MLGSFTAYFGAERVRASRRRYCMKSKPITGGGGKKIKKVKARITVSDYSNAPTTYGEYFTRKEPKHYMGKVVPCVITYEIPSPTHRAITKE